MKFRTDFITNSSSSSFYVTIEFDLKNGESIRYDETGQDGEGDPVVGELYLEASPKQLGTAKDIQEMVDLLKSSVSDRPWMGESAKRVFDADDPKVKRILDGTEEKEAEKEGNKCELKFCIRQREAHEKAQEFIKKVAAIPSMDDIKSIMIYGDEQGRHWDDTYGRKYTYDLETGEYMVRIDGEEFECDGGSGGDLRFSDGKSATWINRDDQDEYEDEDEDL